MRFYKQQHRFYCGVDLHARSMFMHILDHDGRTVFEKDLPAGPGAFLDATGPFRDGLVVGCECMFAWYWLADLCEDESIAFTLGHEESGFSAPKGAATCQPRATPGQRPGKRVRNS